VWECPDLFELPVAGTDESRWVLLISINPGAPNGGSGTQYFIGDFDGTSFTSDQEEARWLDWGTDNYAGVTYNNVPDDDRIFIGWMSNWTYARDTPTEVWRSAMTLPRKLSLEKINEEYTLLNYPISGIEELLNEQSGLSVEIPPNTSEAIVLENGNQSAIHFVSPLTDITVSFKNEVGEELLLELDSEEGLLVLDRSKSGIVDFQEMFANIQQMPLDNLPEGDLEFDIFLDASSVEVFVNKGQFVMTSQLFPTTSFDELVINNDGNKVSLVPELRTYSVKRIWRSGD
ncbi:MAG: glycoside hydrolase family 32 protein, partial [Flavobacteriaceae bacterium]|nr:glycoside hydrolase family 32 protein [Flavobacteriaceae bacterium]